MRSKKTGENIPRSTKRILRYSTAFSFPKARMADRTRLSKAWMKRKLVIPDAESVGPLVGLQQFLTVMSMDFRRVVRGLVMAAARSKKPLQILPV